MHRRCLLLLAIPALLCGADPIAGRWRSVTTTKGGIGAVYEFHAGGKASYSPAAIVEMDYKLDGNLLKLGDQQVGIGWHPDGRLQFNYGKNEIADYTRRGVAPDATRPLLGEWSGTRVMNGQRLPVTLQFHDGNRALLVIYLKKQAGQYRSGTAAQGAWTMTVPPLPPRSLSHDPAGGRLTIMVAGGDPHLFARF